MIKKVKRSALILTFSPRRRDCVRSFREDSDVGSAIAPWTSLQERARFSKRQETIPSPWGEGRGEGGPITLALKSTHENVEEPQRTWKPFR